VKKRSSRSKAEGPRWQDGRLDPEWLANAGRRFVTAWLRDRLGGFDPYQPIDTRADEDPEELVAAIVREVGVQHDATEVIASSVLELLDEARRGDPRAPSYLVRLLRLCQLTWLPRVQSWFAAEVAYAATHKRARWKPPLQRQVLYAAMIQKAGSQADWMQLLDKKASSTLALLALGQSFAKRLQLLPRWWAVTDRKEAERELGQILRAGFREHEPSEVIAMLRSAAPGLPEDLREAIDRRLRALERPAIFANGVPPGVSKLKAIRNAGYTRELVLADAG
jgi:hypothetical protein